MRVAAVGVGGGESNLIDWLPVRARQRKKESSIPVLQPTITVTTN